LRVVSIALQFLWGRSPTILTTNDLNSIPLVKEKKKKQCVAENKTLISDLRAEQPQKSPKTSTSLPGGRNRRRP
jgi:hypothetical protein